MPPRPGRGPDTRPKYNPMRQRSKSPQDHYQDESQPYSHGGRREKTSSINIHGSNPLVKEDVYRHFGQFGKINDVIFKGDKRSAIITYDQLVL